MILPLQCWLFLSTFYDLLVNMVDDAKRRRKEEEEKNHQELPGAKLAAVAQR